MRENESHWRIGISRRWINQHFLILIQLVGNMIVRMEYIFDATFRELLTILCSNRVLEYYETEEA